MQDTDDLGSNPTDNPALGDLIAASLSRRSVLGGAAAAAAVGFFGGSGLLSAAPAAAATEAPATRPLLGFTEVPVSSADTLVVCPRATSLRC